MPLTYSAPAVAITLKIIDSFDINSQALLDELDIDIALLRDPNARFPYEKIDQLWFLAARQAQNPAFGLRAARFWHPSQLGALGYAWLSSATLKNGILRFERYMKILTEGAWLEIEETATTFETVLRYNEASMKQPTRTDSFMAMLFAMCRCNYPNHPTTFRPVAIHLTHPAPMDSTPFTELFGCPVLFNKPDNRFIISQTDALLPLEGNHPQLAQLNDQVMLQYIAKMNKRNIVEQVKTQILEQLPNGNITDTTVGQALFINDRTLQRRLKEENTTFKTLLNEIREELAATYIKDTSLSLSEITFMLGFGNISSFSRAFKRWTGQSPSAFRNDFRAVS